MRLPMTEHVWQQEQTLDAMMERLGVENAIAARRDAGDGYRRARINCIACTKARACRAWLAEESRAATTGSADPMPTCRNRAFFVACRGV